MITREIR